MLRVSAFCCIPGWFAEIDSWSRSMCSLGDREVNTNLSTIDFHARSHFLRLFASSLVHKFRPGKEISIIEIFMTIMWYQLELFFTIKSTEIAPSRRILKLTQYNGSLQSPHPTCHQCKLQDYQSSYFLFSFFNFLSSPTSNFNSLSSNLTHK